MDDDTVFMASGEQQALNPWLRFRRLEFSSSNYDELLGELVDYFGVTQTTLFAGYTGGNQLLIERNFQNMQYSGGYRGKKGIWHHILDLVTDDESIGFCSVAEPFILENVSSVQALSELLCAYLPDAPCCSWRKNRKTQIN